MKALVLGAFYWFWRGCCSSPRGIKNYYFYRNQENDISIRSRKQIELRASQIIQINSEDSGRRFASLIIMASRVIKTIGMFTIRIEKSSLKH